MPWKNVNRIIFHFLIVNKNPSKSYYLFSYNWRVFYLIYGQVAEFGWMRLTANEVVGIKIGSRVQITPWPLKKKEGEKMRVYGIKNAKEFLKKVDECKGNVKLLSSEGDRLNLKSKLCQYIFLSELFKNKETKIPEMELICDDPRDVYLLVDYFISC